MWLSSSILWWRNLDPIWPKVSLVLAGFADSSDVLPVYIGDDRTDEDAFKVPIPMLEIVFLVGLLCCTAEVMLQTLQFYLYNYGLSRSIFWINLIILLLLLYLTNERCENCCNSLGTLIVMASYWMVWSMVAAYWCHPFPSQLRPPFRFGNLQRYYLLPSVNCRAVLTLYDH